MNKLELKVPPVVVFIFFAVIIDQLDRLTPNFKLLGSFQEETGLIIVGIGVIIGLAGVISFYRAKTTVNPHKPESSSSLVTSGIYKFTRNPMYVGLVLGLIGWCLMLNALFGLLTIPLFVWYMNRFQIKPEEKFMRDKFGEEFVRYCDSVRRWV